MDRCRERASSCSSCVPQPLLLEEREERRDDEVDDVRHERLEPFLELRAEDAEDESRQDRALIADDRDGETEDVHHHRLLCAARDGCPCVRELRSDEHEAEDDADDRPWPRPDVHGARTDE